MRWLSGTGPTPRSTSRQQPGRCTGPWRTHAPSYARHTPTTPWGGWCENRDGWSRPGQVRLAGGWIRWQVGSSPSPPHHQGAGDGEQHGCQRRSHQQASPGLAVAISGGVLCLGRYLSAARPDRVDLSGSALLETLQLVPSLSLDVQLLRERVHRVPELLTGAFDVSLELVCAQARAGL